MCFFKYCGHHRDLHVPTHSFPTRRPSDLGDLSAPRRMAERLRLPMTRLSRIAHLNRNTMTAHPASPTVQAKLGEIARIITRAAELAGDEGRAIIWFRHQPIPGFEIGRASCRERVGQYV